MRQWINLVETSTDDDQIDRIIKNSSFSKQEISQATEGLCGTFVLSLYRFLKKRGIHSEIYALSANYPEEYKLGDVHWSHIILEVGNNKYYDIRGRISLEDVQKEFGTMHLYLLDEKELVLELREASKKFQPHYSWKKYKEWGKRFKT